MVVSVGNYGALLRIFGESVTSCGEANIMSLLSIYDENLYATEEKIAEMRSRANGNEYTIATSEIHIPTLVLKTF